MSRIFQGRVMTIAAVAAVALLLLLGVFQATALAAPQAAVQDGEPIQEVTEAIEAAVAWLLETHRNTDGGFSSFSFGADLAPSDIGGTLDALWALGVAGAETGPSVAYLEEHADDLAAYVAQDGSTAGKALLALVPVGYGEDEFAGLNLGVAVTDHLSPTGQFGVNTAFNQSLAMMGLAIAGRAVPEEAIEWLVAQQAADGDFAGSWDDGFGTAGNADSTALALAALRVSGLAEDEPVIVAGLDFLEGAQLDSGGWEYGTGFGENANSTAMVVLALAMLGEDLTSTDSRWVKDGVNPIDALLAWQGESGAFQADFGDGPFDDFFSTVQTLPVLGFSRLLLDSERAGTPAESTVQEMTPTATTAAAEPTETPEPPTATLVPTETPEVVAEQSTDGGTETETGDNEAAGESATTDDAAESTGAADNDDQNQDPLVLRWLLGIGALAIGVILVGWAISRSRRA